MIDVVLKGSEEDCKEFRVEASILDAASEPMFKAIFQPRYGFLVIIFNDCVGLPTQESGAQSQGGLGLGLQGDQQRGWLWWGDLWCVFHVPQLL